MTNLEYLIKNKETLKCDSDTCMCVFGYIARHGHDCKDGENCELCEFDKVDNVLKELNKEHQEPFQLTQFEYDVLKNFIGVTAFIKSSFLMGLKAKGHFKGVYDLSASIAKIIRMSSIVPDNYELG